MNNFSNYKQISVLAQEIESGDILDNSENKALSSNMVSYIDADSWPGKELIYTNNSFGPEVDEPCYIFDKNNTIVIWRNNV